MRGARDHLVMLLGAPSVGQVMWRAESVQAHRQAEEAA